MSVTIYAAGRLDTEDDCLNVSNANFCELMTIIGVPESEYYTDWGLAGLFSVERLRELRPNISAALAIYRAVPDLLDAGGESIVKHASSGLTIIHCEHVPGWYVMRLSSLANRVDDCLDRNVPLQYS